MNTSHRRYFIAVLALLGLTLSCPVKAATQSVWRRIADPATMSTPNGAWNSVWGAADDDLWVVGDSGSIMHWDGLAWTVKPSGTTNKLRHVWGLNSNNVYAVGDAGTILRWNGISWAAMNSGVTSTIYSIWGRSTVELYVTTGSAAPVKGDVLWYNGFGWSQWTSVGTDFPVRGIWGLSTSTSGDDFYFCGDEGDLYDAYENFYTQRPDPDGNGLTFNAMWGPGDDHVWAVGDYGILVYNLGTIDAVDWVGGAVDWQGTVSIPPHLLSVAGVDKDNIWAVGGNGVVKLDAATMLLWKPDAPKGKISNATGVWATGINSVFISTSSGIVWANSPWFSVEQPVGTSRADKSTVDFGLVVNPAVITKTFVVSNNSPVPVTGLSITKSGTAAADYVIGALSSTTLAVGASATFDVTYSPSAEGTRNASITITNTNVDKSTVLINLTGSGRLGASITSLVTTPATSLTADPRLLTVNPSSTVTFKVTAKGSATPTPITYAWKKYNTGTSTWDAAPGVANIATYTITRAADGNEGDYRVVVANTYATATSATISLSVNNPVILSPASPTLQLNPIAKVSGDTVSFTVNVDSSATLPITYVWQRAGKPITGATVTTSAYSNTFTIPSVTTAHGGDISCLVKNVASTSGLVTNKANLTVVDGSLKKFVLPTGGKATFTVTTGGTVNTNGYLWKKNGGPITPNVDHVGITTKTLTINHLILNDDDTYTCDVTGPGGTVTSGIFDLVVYDSAPALASMVTAPLDMGTAIVSGDYTYDIKAQLSALPNQTPTTFSCSNLPPGLKCDATTGVITGKPAVVIPAIPGTKVYTVVITASNAKGKVLAGTPLATLTGTLIVQKLPNSLDGKYVGRIERTTSTALDSGRGSRLDLSVTTVGTYTGGLTLGATAAIPLKGTLNTSVSSTIASHTLLIPAKVPHPAMTLTFTIDASQNLITSASVTDGVTTANLTSGWRNKWSTVTPATDYAGLHTFKLTGPGVADPAAPQGHGYGSFTPSATTGAVTVAGVLADGFAYSTSGYVGPSGEVLLFYVIATTDSLGGVFKMAASGDNNITTDALAIDWARAPQAATATVYETGFGLGIAGHALVNLDASGAKYTPPPPAVGVTPAGVLLQATNDGSSQNAQFAFTGAELGDTAKNPLPYPDFSVRLSAPAKVNSLLLVTAPVLPIKRTVPVPSVSATSGLFSGSFTLYDPRDPGLSNGDLYISRTAKYAGIVIFEAGVPKGYGYFLLAKRPVTAVEKVTTTDQLSGPVTFTKTL